MINTPKSLSDPKHRMERFFQIHEPHVDALTAFVDRIRQERQCGDAVPYFDPADGGVEAKILYVLEAPGANAVRSGFISRNNPDESAKNWLTMNAQAGVPRKKTIIFNIVPWYIGVGGKIRPAKWTDIKQGWPYLVELLGMLPELRIVVLVGRKAQQVGGLISTLRPDLRIMKCPHPSPMFINRKPENQDLLLSALRNVAATLI